MSTAKSMATSYMNAKRNGQSKFNSNFSPTKFKSSTSNLASTSSSAIIQQQNGRLKSTSMSNLIAGLQQENGTTKTTSNRIQRPVSRNALDSIHNGMNAKYAQVQSKVLLQNIRPPSNSVNIVKSKSNTLQATRTGRHTPTGLSAPVKVPSDRTQLLSKLKGLQDELEVLGEERETIRQELEREKADKAEQVQQLKQELQEKLAEHDKQHEEYHRKLLEAYELADQNRRAADGVLSESRQRDEEARKRIEELELQLTELKEFVSMKEEMTGKMYELKEQIREERERYEEQLKSLHQVFENEKLRLEKGGKGPQGGYFKRTKPALDSNESVDKLDGATCRHCAVGRRQLHRSEHDIYGSKLSTRMQDTARSAWKASKHFASSVITGKAVSISGCRKRGSSAEGRAKRPPPSPAAPDASSAQADQHLTSVIKVESTSQQQKQQIHQHQVQQSLIRVDQNNKLTIVTKFNEPDQAQMASNSSGQLELTGQTGQSSIATPNSATGSERSRCESSSSGRGTSSDVGSSSSQNGDELPADDAKGTAGVTSLDGNNNALSEPSQAKDSDSGQESHKQHRRKSSMFRPTRVFGSQASLNKWKYFFTGKDCTGSAKISQPAEVGPLSVHLESSRLRCMELNRAARETGNNQPAELSIAGKSNPESFEPERPVASKEVGQGESVVGEQPSASALQVS